MPFMPSTFSRASYAQARLLSVGEAKAYKGPGSGRIDDDVQLGYWMSQLPGLSVVTFRRYLAWHDRWKAGVTDMIPRLLLAHKVPWNRFADLLDRTESLWHRAPRAQTRVLCDGPPCADCAHLLSQRACIIDIELVGLPEKVNSVSTCWPKCRFSKATPIEVPAFCWNRSHVDHGAASSADASVALGVGLASSGAVGNELLPRHASLKRQSKRGGKGGGGKGIVAQLAAAARGGSRGARV